MTNILTEIASWRHIRSSLGPGAIGFVPTMGNLHAGHISLFQRAKADNTICIASIFVNPTQFNSVEDFKNYPATLEQDIAQLKQVGVDFLLLPTYSDLYPDNYELQIVETDLSTVLEGVHRPSHFTGMLTVVLKLLNLVNPQRVYFGEKDYQQLLLIRKMVTSFFLPVDVVGCPTIREADGLACSSRNLRLTSKDRPVANALYQQLRNTESLSDITFNLTRLGFSVEYIEEHWNRRLGAAWLGTVRLIDNVPVR